MHRFSQVLLTILLGVGWVNAPATGSAQEAPAWRAEAESSLEKSFLEDARDGELNQFSFLDGCLIASGIDTPERLDTYHQRLEILLDEFRSSVGSESTKLDLGQDALRFLHQRILTGQYHAARTLVHTSLDDGNYNCVSATALYLALCRVADVPAIAVATPSHMYARLQLAQAADVQTTHPTWSIAQSLQGAGPSSSVRSRSQTTRNLTSTQLIGKIYYNRGVILLDLRRYAEALPLLERGLSLDPFDGSAAENVLAAINNWALVEAEAGEFARAAKLLKDGMARNPRYEPFLANDLHIHQKWSVALTQQQKYQEAVAILQARYAERPDVPLFDTGRFSIYRMWGQNLLQQQQYEAARKLYADLRLRFPDRREAMLSEQTAFTSAAEDAWKQGDASRARGIVEAGLESDPQSVRLLQLRARLTNSRP